MILYSEKALSLNLHCTKDHYHYVRNGVIEEKDWKHLLEEFPQFLSKSNPSPVNDTPVEETTNESDTEVNNG